MEWKSLLSTRIVGTLANQGPQTIVIYFPAKLKQEDLTVLHELMKAGKVTPAIDRHYGLSEVATPSAIWNKDTLTEKS